MHYKSLRLIKLSNPGIFPFNRLLFKCLRINKYNQCNYKTRKLIRVVNSGIDPSNGLKLKILHVNKRMVYMIGNYSCSRLIALAKEGTFPVNLFLYSLLRTNKSNKVMLTLNEDFQYCQKIPRYLMIQSFHSSLNPYKYSLKQNINHYNLSNRGNLPNPRAKFPFNPLRDQLISTIFPCSSHLIPKLDANSLKNKSEFPPISIHA